MWLKFIRFLAPVVGLFCTNLSSLRLHDEHKSFGYISSLSTSVSICYTENKVFEFSDTDLAFT